MAKRCSSNYESRLYKLNLTLLAACLSYCLPSIYQTQSTVCLHNILRRRLRRNTFLVVKCRADDVFIVYTCINENIMV